jgi:hypothetical protein
MIPTLLMALDTMPMTVSGKVNRRELPRPDFNALRAEYAAPETDGEIYVFCKDARPEPGQFISVRIDSAEEYDLRGTML